MSPLADLPAFETSVRRAQAWAWALAGVAYLAAGVLALLVGWALATLVESRTAEVIRTRMLTGGYSWAHVSTDGLIVSLTGTAPTEAQRFAAVNLAGTLVDSGRLHDDFTVQPAKVVAPPRFSVEMMRNDDGVQLIGLLPEGADRAKLAEAAAAILAPHPPTDMLETAAYGAPAQWEDALTFGVTALKLLPRAKISISAEGVTITAIAASDGEKRQFAAALAQAAPQGLAVTTTISAPRPVLTPFTLRFVIDAGGARFDACSADTDAARDVILAAAMAAGAKGDLTCTVGMGVPSPSWAQATSAAIAALAEMGAGTVTFSDADITLLAADTVSQDRFDSAVGALRATLPDVFSLDAKMAPKAQASAEPTKAEFTATLDAKTHRADLRGRLGDSLMQSVVTSFAKARFGADKVYIATLADQNLPDGWTERVMAGLQALSVLEQGKVVVLADTVEITGVSGQKTASDKVSQILSDRLGQGSSFKVAVRYDKALDPMEGLPTPPECLDRLQAAQSQHKISFDPGSAELDAASSVSMGALAQALKNCTAVKIEIGGHTDAQGSVQGNLALSQARAEAVLMALLNRDVDVSAMRAVGYGESVPIADNATEAGREINRRIEFTLMQAATGAVPGPDGKPAAQTTPDATALSPDAPTLTPPRRPKGPCQTGCGP